ncbi:DUF4062 domain-containing protein [Mammaliicoccus sciuri]|uniref:DUF4062 domain-containing protein n=1 Tax=Mammaliicoccus sciuri TaxID=1296 RepID=UPI002DBD9C1D|nr:DUF4062 domain-containing protein [Mammaliicoccus sciuri]MEB7733449.1 DUF4062 domain-containing protein [Mammaliicoccus sciuri]
MINSNIEKKFQIFVSSTYKDLKKERQALVEAILESNNIPAGMELFNASSSSQWQIIEKWIKEADIVVLLVGERYGTIDDKSGKSFTHLEFDYATKLNKPIFVFKMSEDYIKQREINEKAKLVEQTNQTKFKEFTDLILKDRNSSLDIDSIDKLKLEVTKSLYSETKNLPGGWVKHFDVQDSNENLNKPVGDSKEKDFRLYEEIFHDTSLIYKDVINIHTESPDAEFNAIVHFTDFLKTYSSAYNPTFNFMDERLNSHFDSFYDNIENLLNILMKFKNSSEHINEIISLQGNIRKDFSNFENRARHLFY